MKTLFKVSVLTIVMLGLQSFGNVAAFPKVKEVNKDLATTCNKTRFVSDLKQFLEGEDLAMALREAAVVKVLQRSLPLYFNPELLFENVQNLEGLCGSEFWKYLEMQCSSKDHKLIKKVSKEYEKLKVNGRPGPIAAFMHSGWFSFNRYISSSNETFAKFCAHFPSSNFATIVDNADDANDSKEDEDDDEMKLDVRQIDAVFRAVFDNRVNNSDSNLKLNLQPNLKPVIDETERDNLLNMVRTTLEGMEYLDTTRAPNSCEQMLVLPKLKRVAADCSEIMKRQKWMLGGRLSDSVEIRSLFQQMRGPDEIHLKHLERLKKYAGQLKTPKNAKDVDSILVKMAEFQELIKQTAKSF